MAKKKTPKNRTPKKAAGVDGGRVAEGKPEAGALHMGEIPAGEAPEKKAEQGDAKKAKLQEGGSHDDTAEEKKPLGKAVMDEVKFFVGLFGFLLVFYTFGFGHYKIPSESMQPTLEVGDHLYVSKFAYGYSRESLPFGLSRLPVPEGKILSRLPKRGDVVVFKNPRSGIVMIKRAIGLPGDEIVVSRGRFYLNGEIIDRKNTGEFTVRADYGPRSIPQIITWRNRDHDRWGYKITVNEYEEQWPDEDKPHLIYEVSDMATLDNVRPMIVPAGTVFFMGDNRDRSLDSRAVDGPGFVPLDHLIGRADRMMFSFKKCPDEVGIYCPKRGFMLGL